MQKDFIFGLLNGESLCDTGRLVQAALQALCVSDPQLDGEPGDPQGCELV
jgi:hypothetical protein